MNFNITVIHYQIFSQKVLLLLIGKGISREEAYKLVQKNAHSAWNTENGNFKENLKKDDYIMNLISDKELDQCFDPSIHLNNLNVIWDRLNI